ncbi:unnamed protein product [Lymnaea stagnalis]|uniref:WD repeat-containing protein 62 n=1 Tax=Lymnaea stagnalis TaxID=6523 RepID=A0AAV2HHQ4_LYMST
MASGTLVLSDRDAEGQKPTSQDEFILEQVLGLTSTSCHALAHSPTSGVVAFPAACMLVLLDPKTNDQKFMESPTVHCISCVSFTEDGRMLAFGEHGLKPHISVWLVKEHKEYSKFIVDHSVGIRAIAFHPKSAFLVALGNCDLNIGVWDYVRGRRLALTKWQTSPLAMTIPRPGAYVAVCGHRKVTLFNIDRIDSNTHETNVFQDRKAVLLGRQSEYTFVDIASGRNKHEREVYTVTSCGFLCEIKMGDIVIDKASKVDTRAYVVRYAMDHVFVGCREGVVKICHPDTLNVEAAVSVNQLLGPEGFTKIAGNQVPDTTAIAVNEKDSIVTCIFSDGSMHSWQINSFKDTIVCSMILPPTKHKQKGAGNEAGLGEQAYKAGILRSLVGSNEKAKRSKAFDSVTMSDKAQKHHGVLNFKASKSRFQQANAVQFTPDGKDIICGNDAGEIKVYDAASGFLRRVIEAHSSQVTCIELMYDDEYQLVCSGGRDRIIFVLNAKTDFGLVQVLCDHSAAITALSLVHNSGLLTLVSAAADNVILVRRALPGSTLKFTITGEIAEARYNKSFNVTSEYIVTGAGNGGIKLWKADPVFSGKPSKMIPCTQKCSSGHRAMAIDPSGSFLAITQCPGQITVYHLQTGQPVASLSSQNDVNSVKFSNDLRYMISSTSNGCSLVWRLPERMTEFMRSKQEKTYQIEMAREISYETYVSCLRVCKEVPDDDGPQHNDSHNFDLDLTPSIESLSLLDLGGNRGSQRESVYGSDSFISCTTCQGSCSDSALCYPSTDSSVHISTMPTRYPGVTKDNVEQGRCTKLGMFKYVRSLDADGLPEMYHYKSRTITSPPKSAGDATHEHQKAPNINVSDNNGDQIHVLSDLEDGYRDTDPVTDQLNPYVSEINGDFDKVFKFNEMLAKSDQLLNRESCPIPVPQKTTITSPVKLQRLLSPASDISYSTANSMVTSRSTDTSATCEYLNFFSPLPETSVSDNEAVDARLCQRYMYRDDILSNKEAVNSVVGLGEGGAEIPVIDNIGDCVAINKSLSTVVDLESCQEPCDSGNVESGGDLGDGEKRLVVDVVTVHSAVENESLNQSREDVAGKRLESDVKITPDTNVSPQTSDVGTKPNSCDDSMEYQDCKSKLSDPSSPGSTAGSAKGPQEILSNDLFEECIDLSNVNSKTTTDSSVYACCKEQHDISASTGDILTETSTVKMSTSETRDKLCELSAHTFEKHEGKERVDTSADSCGTTMHSEIVEDDYPKLQSAKEELNGTQMVLDEMEHSITLGLQEKTKGLIVDQNEIAPLTNSGEIREKIKCRIVNDTLKRANSEELHDKRLLANRDDIVTRRNSGDLHGKRLLVDNDAIVTRTNSGERHCKSRLVDIDGLITRPNSGELHDKRLLVDHDNAVIRTNSGEPLEKSKRPVLDHVDDGTVFNYHSITRDQNGRLRWIGQKGNSSRDQPVEQKSPSPTDAHVVKHGSNCLGGSLWNIKCSRCARKNTLTEIGSGSEKEALDNQNPKDFETWDCCKHISDCQDQSKLEGHAARTDGDVDPIGLENVGTWNIDQKCPVSDQSGDQSGDQETNSQDCQMNTSEACDLLLNPARYFDKRDQNVCRNSQEDPSLKEYYSDLRQCLQLSNSQETFYRLKWDVDDQELMELLSLALECKPAEFAEWFSSQKGAWKEKESVAWDDDVKEPVNEESGTDLILPRVISKLEKLCKARGLINASSTTDSRSDQGSSTSLPESSSSKTNIISILERFLSGRKSPHKSMPKIEEMEETVRREVNSEQDVHEEMKRERGKRLNYFMTNQETKLQHQVALADDEDESVTSGSSCPSRHATTSCMPGGAICEIEEKPGCVEGGRLNTRNTTSVSYSSGAPIDLSPHTYPTKCSFSLNPGKLKVPDYSHKNGGHDVLSRRWLSSSEADSTDTTDTSLGSKKSDVQKETNLSCRGQDQLEASGDLSKTKTEEVPERRVVSDSTPSSGGRVFTPSLVELFRDQDDYLRKLKEVREKFEESIQALSNERKSRRARDESMTFNKS